MQLSDIQKGNYDFSGVARTYVKNGQSKRYCLGLIASNGRNSLDITFPKKIGECEVEAKFSEDELSMTGYLNNTGLGKLKYKIIAVASFQSKGSLYITVVSESSNGLPLSFTVKFKPKCADVILNEGDIDVQWNKVLKVD